MWSDWNDWKSLARTTPAGERFERGWKTYIGEQKLQDTFWDPVDLRWETYDDRFQFQRSALPVINVSHGEYGLWQITEEVLRVGEITRAFNDHIIWWPISGRWYQWSAAEKPKPAPPPEPEWLTRMNAELDAVSRNTHLSPEEVYRARIAIEQRYYGVAKGI